MKILEIMPNMKSLQKLGTFSPKKGRLDNRCHKKLPYQMNRFVRSLVCVTTLRPTRKGPKIEILIQSSVKAFDLSKCPEVSRAIFWGSEFLLELGRPSVRDVGKDILTRGQSLGSRSLGSRPAVILSWECQAVKVVPTVSGTSFQPSQYEGQSWVYPSI